LVSLYEITFAGIYVTYVTENQWIPYWASRELTLLRGI
jgi:hypothetical protein